ncbi:MAG: aspartate carbamoyltransferase catalytic subunit [Verrucomicrobiota bacterium]
MSELKPRKDLLDIEDLSREELEYLLEAAKPFKDLITKSIKKVPPLKGKSVLTLFYEPSTRTRSSFEIAAKRLSADVTNFSVSSSSVVKGESILDTVDTLQSMRVDYIVVRHGHSGVPNLIARHTGASVLNAGDGWHSHPTQALLDAFTLREVHPESTGKRVLLIGDILHSRVARSVRLILRKLEVEVGLLGPKTLMPSWVPEDSPVFDSWEDAMKWSPEVIYLLRVQKERQDEQFFPTLHEYHRIYGLTGERLEQVRAEGIHIMHPGPVNRGVEVADAVMEYERSLINQQVENGIAARMAVLYWLRPKGSRDE